jgi:hypothetical protein
LAVDIGSPWNGYGFGYINLESFGALTGQPLFQDSGPSSGRFP